MLTKASAIELAPFGIRVNAVAPCIVDTNLYRYAGYSEEEYEGFKKRASQNIPLLRIARDEEVAKAIIFLTSDKSCPKQRLMVVIHNNIELNNLRFIISPFD